MEKAHRLGTVLIGMAIGLFLCMGIAVAAEHEFAGVKKCSICHKKEETGNQYGQWLETKHAKAFERLASPEAKAAGAERGIADPQTSPKCLKCHSTAYYFSEEQVSTAITVEEGVSCESCHGPGKDYMSKTVMKDHDQAVAKGMVVPTEETCLKCHNQESPTFKPFNFEERWHEIMHSKPKS